jgi:UDP-N-acetylglucosamine 2-epimerase (non-hydrolysing)
VIAALSAGNWCSVRVLATGQHRSLLDSAFADFGIRPDYDLDVMRPNQGLSALAGRLLEGIDAVLDAERPAAVVVQGDTTSVLAGALAAFHRKIPVAHVEAGLRTGSSDSPFPEEMNRVIVARLARWHFAPTRAAMNNLLREGIPEGNVEVTGNTGIDALRLVVEELRSKPADAHVQSVLVTAHRRENFGAPLLRICAAVRQLAARHSQIRFQIPVHPNPSVRETIHRELEGTSRVELLDAMPYREFSRALAECTLVLTDSGGVQEEAPFLGKPVLVLREETERQEAVEAGVARLVGSSTERICSEVDRLLTDSSHYAAMSRGVSPFGDGRASERIARRLREDLT